MKERHDAQYEMLTKTPVLPLVARLSVPTILSMLITNVYNLADTAFVGRLGNSASGAVGIVFGFMSIIQAVGFLFGQGSGSILSRREGMADYEGATRAASIGFFSSLFFALIIEVFCFLNLDPLVHALGSTDTIAPYAKTYIAYILFAAPFMVSSYTMNNILRYEGKAAMGTMGMMTGALINIAADPILMFGFGMGIKGAGLSTAVSQAISFCIMLSMFLRGKTKVKFSLKAVFSEGALRDFFDVFGTGLPSLLRQALNSVTTVLLNSTAAIYGDTAVSAMSIVNRIAFFVFSIALGIGQGFQPVCAFNYGAGRYDRVRKAYKVTISMAESVMIFMTVLVMIFSGSLIKVFRDDPTVIEIGTRALRLQILGQVFLPFCMVNEMAMQSTGRKVGASVLSATRSGIFFIPLLLYLSSVRGLEGIQEAQPAAMVLSLIPAAYFGFRFFRELKETEKRSIQNLNL